MAAVRCSAALLVWAAVQVALSDGIQQNPITKSPPVTLTETSKEFDTVHGIQKRSVSILARNGDLPYFRKEWNKKLHPGFRGMNVDDKDEESAPNKRYVASLARGGGYPAGKRAVGSPYDVLEDLNPEEEPFETYTPEDWSREDVSDLGEVKRGGISSLARAKGFVTYQGQYGNGKRSVAALARSGELLSIGRGSSHERESSGSTASKRGLGSLLRNGGISTIGKIPVYTMGSPTNGKRGIESLARNYALPSMISQEYDGKFDAPEAGFEDSSSITEPFYEEALPSGESDEPPEESDAEALIAKRHLGSFVRTFGLKPGTKRNIGSILRNGGGFSHNGKRSEEFSHYDPLTMYNDKRHFSSLLKGHGAYVPYKREMEEDEEYSGVQKRYLASILNDRNAIISGKRYLGSIARQGLLGSRHEKKDDTERAFNDGPWSLGDSSVGKRSITEGDSGLLKSEPPFNRQGNSRTRNGTTEDELKSAAGPLSGGGIQKRSTGLPRGEKKEANEDSSKHRRQRRSLMVPYTSSDEYPMPVLQNTDFYDLGNTEEEELEGSPGKRFMGSLDRWGWFPRQFPRTVVPDDGGGASATRPQGGSRRTWPEGGQPHKRHIGALARLGWLPAIRSQRRYSRGLGKRYQEEYISRREDTAHGTQPAASHGRPGPVSPPSPLAVSRPSSGDGALAAKRYLLLPAMDHLLLRKLYPRQMLPLLV